MPVFESEDALRAFLPLKMHSRLEALRPIKHVLTHKDLKLSPVIAGFSESQELPLKALHAAEPEIAGAWFSSGEWQALGLPAPIRKLLEDDGH